MSLYHCRDNQVLPFAHLALYAANLRHATTRSFPSGRHQLEGVLSQIAADILALSRDIPGKRRDVFAAESGALLHSQIPDTKPANPQLLKIISGGQTGVDRGALQAAIDVGVECGGWCPAGRLAEDGRIPERYPVRELPVQDYSTRTAQNVADSDGTLIVCTGEPRGGTHETIEFCRQTQKPHLVIDLSRSDSERAVELVQKFISNNHVKVLNVAGPRASQWRAGYEVARQIVSGVLRAFIGHKEGPAYSS